MQDKTCFLPLWSSHSWYVAAVDIPRWSPAWSQAVLAGRQFPAHRVGCITVHVGPDSDRSQIRQLGYLACNLKVWHPQTNTSRQAPVWAESSCAAEAGETAPAVALASRANRQHQRHTMALGSAPQVFRSCHCETNITSARCLHFQIGPAALRLHEPEHRELRWSRCWPDAAAPPPEYGCRAATLQNAQHAESISSCTTVTGSEPMRHFVRVSITSTSTGRESWCDALTRDFP